jgi:hypothetical protein
MQIQKHEQNTQQPKGATHQGSEMVGLVLHRKLMAGERNIKVGAVLTH